MCEKVVLYNQTDRPLLTIETMSTPSPRQILETLLPHLRVAAAYARFIQPKITALPVKEGENFFAQALSDADLSIQNFVEVVLLGTFPSIRFYGEELDRSPNTKYFRSTELGPPGDYLVTLDPIDGTQFYLDGHLNYQIVVGVLNTDEFEAALAISPGEDTYFYAIRGEGVFKGALNQDLNQCTPLKIQPSQASILLGFGMTYIKPRLSDRYTVFALETDYSSDRQVPSVNGMFGGDLCGAMVRAAKFIDVALLAFMAKEAGCIVTGLDGSPLPPLHACENYSQPGLMVAASEAVHRDLLAACRG